MFEIQLQNSVIHAQSEASKEAYRKQLSNRLTDKELDLIRLVFQDYVENLDGTLAKKLDKLLIKLQDIKKQQYEVKV